MCQKPTALVQPRMTSGSRGRLPSRELPLVHAALLFRHKICVKLTRETVCLKSACTRITAASPTSHLPHLTTIFLRTKQKLPSFPLYHRSWVASPGSTLDISPKSSLVPPSGAWPAMRAQVVSACKSTITSSKCVCVGGRRTGNA